MSDTRKVAHDALCILGAEHQLAWKQIEGAVMPIQLNEEIDGKILDIQVSGKLTKADYEHFVPEFERLVWERGKLQLLFDMTAFHGWDAGALWDDIKFDYKHVADVKRIAMVGDQMWQQGMAAFCEPFTTAPIRYFDRSHADEARRWLVRGGDR